MSMQARGLTYSSASEYGIFGRCCIQNLETKWERRVLVEEGVLGPRPRGLGPIISWSWGTPQCIQALGSQTSECRVKGKRGPWSIGLVVKFLQSTCGQDKGAIFPRVPLLQILNPKHPVNGGPDRILLPSETLQARSPLFALLLTFVLSRLPYESIKF